ncbi:MAG TPA: hypothetical protein VM260_11830 [Pirellula sp.]|nr:hypothetical protein [Pirellula sp.]
MSVHLGMVAKIRPCLVLSIPSDDENDRVLTTLVPHTTSTRQSRFEIVIRTPFLRDGALDAKHHHDPDYKARSQVGEIDCRSTFRSGSVDQALAWL